MPCVLAFLLYLCDRISLMNAVFTTKKINEL